MADQPQNQPNQTHQNPNNHTQTHTQTQQNKTKQTNNLNKQPTKKTECRYSTSTIESKILNEQKEIKEK